MNDGVFVRGNEEIENDERDTHANLNLGNMKLYVCRIMWVSSSFYSVN